MEKKNLKELIASRQDDAIIADVVLIEETIDYDTKELTGYKIFARIPETNELPEIRLSFQKFNTETEAYEVDKDKEKFTKDVIKEVFGGKIKDFTGEIQVWQFTTSKGEKMYSVYPLAIFTRADKFEDTNADLSKINAISSEIYHELTGKQESFLVNYVLKSAVTEENNENQLNNAEIVEFYHKELQKRQKLDLLRGYTSIGPHRDDLLFQVDGNNLRAFGSQGQQRSAALALKLAEVEFIKEKKEEYPVLLLDDVMSELDENRRQQLLKFITGKVQTFITLNDKKLVDNLVESKYFKVEKGIIKEE